MRWTVIYYTDNKGVKPVKKWLETLDESASSKLFRNLVLLETLGLGIREPYVKHLGNKLYEVRAKDHKGIYRVIYFASRGQKFVLLHGFVKKTEKTPRKELAIAKERMKEFQDE